MGGGPAGATAARLLASLGRRVVLVEASAAPRAKVGEVLAPSARPILESLGLRERIDSDPALARRCLGVVSDWNGPFVRDYLREPGGLGWILDRRAFEALLARDAVEAGVDWRWSHRLRSVERLGSGLRLIVSVPGADGQQAIEIDPAFAVDASGRAGALARRIGGKRRVATRLIARQEPPGERPSPISGSAWVRISAEPDGWHYAAEGPNRQKHSLFFSRQAAPSGMSAPGWEAGFSMLDRAHGDHWVAIGDSAAAFDPLTSQGIPNALTSAVAAVDSVEAALGGRTDAMRAYAEAMRATWAHSLAGAANVYESERRWPDRSFWTSIGADMSSSGIASRSITHPAPL